MFNEGRFAKAVQTIPRMTIKTIACASILLKVDSALVQISFLLKRAKTLITKKSARARCQSDPVLERSRSKYPPPLAVAPIKTETHGFQKTTPRMIHDKHLLGRRGRAERFVTIPRNALNCTSNCAFVGPDERPALSTDRA